MLEEVWSLVKMHQSPGPRGGSHRGQDADSFLTSAAVSRWSRNHAGEGAEGTAPSSG